MGTGIWNSNSISNGNANGTILLKLNWKRYCTSSKTKCIELMDLLMTPDTVGIDNIEV
jgi:hypothetical protein